MYSTVRFVAFDTWRTRTLSPTERYRNSYPSASRIPALYATVKPAKAQRWLPPADRFTSGSQTLSRTVRHSASGETGSDARPHYQFRKSNSMKMALREMDEGDLLMCFVLGCLLFFRLCSGPDMPLLSLFVYFLTVIHS